MYVPKWRIFSTSLFRFKRRQLAIDSFDRLWGFPNEYKGKLGEKGKNKYYFKFFFHFCIKFNLNDSTNWMKTKNLMTRPLNALLLSPLTEFVEAERVWKARKLRSRCKIDICKINFLVSLIIQRYILILYNKLFWKEDKWIHVQQ